MDAPEFLRSLEALPDLLDLAIQQDKLRRYEVQESLRRRLRGEGRPFLYSMPMRHLDTCPLCGAQFTAVRHELENPACQACVEFSGIVLHQARLHAVPPPEEVAAFVFSFIQE